MERSLEKQLAAFLKKARGDATYAQFARKLGMSPSTLHRLESQGQSATLKLVEQIMSRLKVDLTGIFRSDKNRDSN